MREREAHERRYGRGRHRLLARAGASVSVAALLSAGCGGDEKRQDANEPTGRYKVQLTSAEFPKRQKLARRSTIRLVVKNVDSRTIPNIAVTLRGLDTRETAADDSTADDPTLADPQRPVFVVNGRPAEIGGIRDSQQAAPEGGQTAYVDTYALGKLAPGKSRTFRWNVTAVRAGRYRLSYVVAAGLDGKARAVGPEGEPVRGRFAGRVSEEAPDTKVASDGEKIVRE